MFNTPLVDLARFCGLLMIEEAVVVWNISFDSKSLTLSRQWDKKMKLSDCCRDQVIKELCSLSYRTFKLRVVFHSLVWRSSRCHHLAMFLIIMYFSGVGNIVPWALCLRDTQAKERTIIEKWKFCFFLSLVGKIPLWLLTGPSLDSFTPNTVRRHVLLV